MDAKQSSQAAAQEHQADRLLVNARMAAALCAKSLRTWRTWDAAGWVPRPVRIGRSTLWRADELRAWTFIVSLALVVVVSAVSMCRQNERLTPVAVDGMLTVCKIVSVCAEP